MVRLSQGAGLPHHIDDVEEERPRRMTRGHRTLLAAALIAALAATGAATRAAAQAQGETPAELPPPPEPPPPPPSLDEASVQPQGGPAPAAVPESPAGWPEGFSFQGPGPYSPYSDLLTAPAPPPPAAYRPSPPPPYAYPAPAPAYYPPAAYEAAAQPAPPPPPPAPPPPQPGMAAAPAPMPPREIAAAPGETTGGEERNPLFGIISEARAGFLIHDAGVFGGRKEKSEDVDLELLFTSPESFDFMWSPRPIVGVHINDSNDTNQLFAGLVWEWWFWKPLYIDFSFGLAVHDGAIDTEELGRKSLGSRVLFREALELGWNFYGGHDIGVMLDHVSHGNLLGSRNEGLDTLGVHYGYRF
jgi:lipid A 3-O-deacylase